MDNIQIIILAAGLGKRMGSNTPKALTQLKGRPFIHHILETIKKLDPKLKPVIVVGHKKEDIKKALGPEHVYAEQKEQLGTGHAVMSAKDNVRAKHETLLVLHADQPTTSLETLQEIIQKHSDKKPAITMGTVVVPDFKDWRVGLKNYGRIVRGANGSVKSIVEWRDANEKEQEIKELNPALYAFDAKWLWKNIDKLKNKNVKKEFYLTDLVKMACDQNEKIETVQVTNMIEALQPNTKEELEILENLVK